MSRQATDLAHLDLTRAELHALELVIDAELCELRITAESDDSYGQTLAALGDRIESALDGVC